MKRNAYNYSHVAPAKSMTPDESPITTRARSLLAAFTDAEILCSTKHTTPNEPEILKRLRRVDMQLSRETGCTQNLALTTVNKILRERRKAARKAE